MTVTCVFTIPPHNLRAPSREFHMAIFIFFAGVLSVSLELYSENPARSTAPQARSLWIREGGGALRAPTFPGGLLLRVQEIGSGAENSPIERTRRAESIPQVSARRGTRGMRRSWPTPSGYLQWIIARARTDDSMCTPHCSRAEITVIDVSQRAESIGDGFSFC